MERLDPNENSAGSAAEDKIKSEPKESTVRKKKKRTTASYAVELLIKIAVTLLCAWLLCTYVIVVHVNHGNSAYPMIKDGDLCIGYRLSELKGGEEVLYRHDGKLCLGRIAARANETVEIKNGAVYVEGYGILEDVVYETTEDGSKITYPYVVPENSLFILNDFREDVYDSRTFGAIDLSDVEGKVIFIMRRRGI